MTNLVLASNHGDTLEPKEGGDVRKCYLALGLAKKNSVIILESNRYKRNIHHIPNISIKYYKENSILGKPLSPFTDLNPSFITNMWKLSEKADLIQISFPFGIIATKTLLTIKRKKIPLVYDAHNVESDLVKEVPPAIPRPFSSILAKYIQLLERLSVRCADHIIAVSNSDALRFSQKYCVPMSNITVIPSGANPIAIDLSKRAKFRNDLCIKEQEIVVLFHGTYRSASNREAMELISNSIAPQIGGEVKFIIAGTDVPKTEKGAVKYLGYVKDLSALLAAADIAVVPLVTGGGTKLKIFDYMSASLPIVATAKAVEGIDIENQNHALIVTNIDDEFINSIRYLVERPNERARLGSNAKQLLVEKYCWPDIGEKLSELYNDIINASDKPIKA